MNLVDYQIKRLIEEGLIISSYNLIEQINPASLDIRIGRYLKEEIKPPLWLRLLWEYWPQKAFELDKGPAWKTIDLQPYTKKRPYWLKSRRFILTESEEVFYMPDNLSADFKLKSSAGREGYEHALAGFCDPGWHDSRLTKELTNIRQWRAIPIYPGLQLGQLVFQQLNGIPERTYAETGRYNGDLQVEESKGLS